MNKSLPPDLPKTKTFTFSAETEELDAVLSFVNAPLDALGVSEEEKIILDIAVEEIYVNIALYAYQPGRGLCASRLISWIAVRPTILCHGRIPTSR